jgi:hypothetical protein
MSNYNTPICPNSVSLDQCYVGKIDEALTNFNSAFQCYQQGCTNNCGAKNGVQCNFNNVVQPAYSTLMATIEEVLQKTKTLDLPNYDASMNEIQTRYQELLLLRENIDKKMKELNETYTTHGGIPNSYQEDFDNTLTYTHILWVMLATSIVYFIFLKIKD